MAHCLFIWANGWAYSIPDWNFEEENDIEKKIGECLEIDLNNDKKRRSARILSREHFDSIPKFMWCCCLDVLWFEINTSLIYITSLFSYSYFCNLIIQSSIQFPTNKQVKIEDKLIEHHWWPCQHIDYMSQSIRWFLLLTLSLSISRLFL